MAVLAVIRILTGGIKVGEARSSGGETKIVHTDTAGRPTPVTTDRSGRVVDASG